MIKRSLILNLKDSTMIKNMALDEISQIRFGYYAQPKSTGEAAYLQLRQFDEDGRQVAQSDEFINIDKKAEAHVLKPGDVLFAGKGNRLFSSCYKNTEGPAIASSVFFVIRPDNLIIDSEFLAAILNAPQSKATFKQIGAGTNIFSIRKSELGAFQVPILPKEQQKAIAKYSELYYKDIQLTQEMLRAKQELYTAVISKLI